MTTRLISHELSPTLPATGSGPTKTEELIVELRALVGDSQEQSAEILNAMARLWNCADPSQVAAQLVHFNGNARVQRILESARWVFQEQNVFEWPNRGRQRPLHAIAQALNTPLKYDQSRC